MFCHVLVKVWSFDWGINIACSHWEIEDGKKSLDNTYIQFFSYLLDNSGVIPPLSVTIFWCVSILSILTFLTIMSNSSLTSYNHTMKSSFALPTNNNCKDCEVFQKYHIHQQCNEDSALKGGQKDISFKLGLLHISKVIRHEPYKTS
jgi:hypothetical protein